MRLPLVGLFLSLFLAAPGFAQPPAELIPGHFIVVLRDEIPGGAVPDIAREMARTHGLSLGPVYQHALRGFAAAGPDASLSLLRSDPRVKYIAADRVLRAIQGAPGPVSPQIVPTGIRRVHADRNSFEGTPEVVVAVIDTGIKLDQPDLAANIRFDLGANFTSEPRGAGGNDTDAAFSHGTHVAGVIAAIDNNIDVIGVASQVKLAPVKVLGAGGLGSFASVIAGVDFVTAHADEISVANMSLGGGGRDDGNCGQTNGDPFHEAICNSTAAGVVYVVAAGNSAADASTSVPAAYDEVLSVSALDDRDGTSANDRFASFSNFGADIDIIAPGVRILSTDGDGGVSSLSGTSFSSPHVAGGVALWIAQNGRPSTGDATTRLIRRLLRDISEDVGLFPGDPDGIAEALLNADTRRVGGTGSSVK